MQCDLLKPITLSLSSHTMQSVNNNPWRHCKDPQTSQVNVSGYIPEVPNRGLNSALHEKIQGKLITPLEPFHRSGGRVLQQLQNVIKAQQNNNVVVVLKRSLPIAAVAGQCHNYKTKASKIVLYFTQLDTPVNSIHLYFFWLFVRPCLVPYN